jgi:hypothetical protein
MQQNAPSVVGGGEPPVFLEVPSYGKIRQFGGKISCYSKIPRLRRGKWLRKE